MVTNTLTRHSRQAQSEQEDTSDSHRCDRICTVTTRLKLSHLHVLASDSYAATPKAGTHQTQDSVEITIFSPTFPPREFNETLGSCSTSSSRSYASTSIGLFSRMWGAANIGIAFFLCLAPLFSHPRINHHLLGLTHLQQNGG
jgi:hypothetical protein